MTVRCDAPGCVRGILHRPLGWGDPCPVCKGLGTLSLAEVARLLGENEQTLKRLSSKNKMRVKTCQRILNAVLKIITPPKQPGLFG